jgi:hypothetical protein
MDFVPLRMSVAGFNLAHTTSTNISSWIKWLVGGNVRKSNAMKCDVGVLFCAV